MLVSELGKKDDLVTTYLTPLKGMQSLLSRKREGCRNFQGD